MAVVWCVAAAVVGSDDVVSFDGWSGAGVVVAFGAVAASAPRVAFEDLLADVGWESSAGVAGPWHWGPLGVAGVRGLLRGLAMRVHHVGMDRGRAKFVVGFSFWAAVVCAAAAWLFWEWARDDYGDPTLVPLWVLLGVGGVCLALGFILGLVLVLTPPRGVSSEGGG